MNQKYGGGIYWLLDSRFDFLLPSFTQEFRIGIQDILFVHSYHWKERENLNKILIVPPEQNRIRMLEPDDLNRIFSSNLELKQKTLLISFTGAGLPESEHLETLTAVGLAADKWNDKWQQFVFFQEKDIVTPFTYKFSNFAKVQKQLPFLADKHKKIIIKKPCLSGGYMMQVLSSAAELNQYRQSLHNSSLEEVFLVSEYIPHRQSFASAAIVKKSGEVFYLDMVTEQVIYQETAYEGLIFPAFLDDIYMKKIREMTVKIGKELGNNGYYGYYNVDFILGNDGQLYVIEINARLGFGTILAACLYENRFWNMMLHGVCKEGIRCPAKRLILGKIKGREGRVYSGLHSVSKILEWFHRENGFFKTFFCGTKMPEMLAYGSFIGLFGEYLPLEDSREKVLKQFWDKCLEYYDGMEKS